AAWIIAAVIILLYALNIAELSSRFPHAGGLYTYPAETLGATPAVRQFAPGSPWIGGLAIFLVGKMASQKASK
ncbi:MAG TPA: hypothetical protein DCL63_07065, partial [Firmicutes bacterium]|nr:hypothetical protein [Bacillota bacterium]